MYIFYYFTTFYFVLLFIAEFFHFIVLIAQKRYNKKTKMYKEDNHEPTNKRNPSKEKIADKILWQIGGSVIFVLLLIAVVAVCMVGWLSITSKETELIQESNAAANQLTGFLEQYTKSVEQMAVNPEVKSVLLETKPGSTMGQAEKIDTVMENLSGIANTDTENVMAAWISDLDTSSLMQSDGFVSDENWDITGRGWYGCIETKKTVLTEPYVDSSTGKMILSAACPVIDDATGDVPGAVGMDIALDHMTQIMSGYKIGKKGYMLLLSENGTFLYHPQSDIIQKNVTEVNISRNVADAIASKTDIFLQYKADGIIKYGSLQRAGDTGYIVLSSMPMSEYYATLAVMVIALILIFAIGIILIAVSIRKSAASLAKPILELNHTAQRLAAGDLDVTIQITSEDEIGELGESFQKTVNRLKEYIAYIDETAEVLAQIADGKLSIHLKYDYVGEFQKIKTALLNISDSMNQVMLGINDSPGAYPLSGRTGHRFPDPGGRRRAAGRIHCTACRNDSYCNRSGGKTAVGKQRLLPKATARAADMIEQNQVKMKQMMDATNEIHQTSQQVVGIIQTIEEIASQTNLLSLNASIEAARA